MYPSLFGLNSYNLWVVLGLVAGLGLFLGRARCHRLPLPSVFWLGVTALLMGGFGARLLNWLYLPGDYVPIYGAFLTLEGGFALNGGILLILATVALVSRVRRLDFLAVADLMVPSAPLAIVFFRLGCFSNGCCGGRPTELPWGIHLPLDARASLLTSGMALHPTQIYAILSALVILGVLAGLARRTAPTGTLLAVFLLMYGVFRTLIDLTRLPDPKPDLQGVLLVNQGLNLVLAMMGLWLLVHLRRRAPKIGPELQPRTDALA